MQRARERKGNTNDMAQVCGVGVDEGGGLFGCGGGRLIHAPADSHTYGHTHTHTHPSTTSALACSATRRRSSLLWQTARWCRSPRTRCRQVSPCSMHGGGALLAGQWCAGGQGGVAHLAHAVTRSADLPASQCSPYSVLKWLVYALLPTCHAQPSLPLSPTPRSCFPLPAVPLAIPATLPTHPFPSFLPFRLQCRWLLAVQACPPMWCCGTTCPRAAWPT